MHHGREHGTRELHDCLEIRCHHAHGLLACVLVEWSGHAETCAAGEDVDLHAELFDSCQRGGPGFTLGQITGRDLGTDAVLDTQLLG
jgi:hypothetical protein